MTELFRKQVNKVDLFPLKRTQRGRMTPWKISWMFKNRFKSKSSSSRDLVAEEDQVDAIEDDWWRKHFWKLKFCSCDMFNIRPSFDMFNVRLFFICSMFVLLLICSMLVLFFYMSNVLPSFLCDQPLRRAGCMWTIQS